MLSKEIERIHLKFCKRVLGCRKSTPNVAVYGELGRYPLYISRFVRIIKYWFKVLNSDNIIIKKVYQMSYIDCLNGKKNWVSSVKKLLYDYGFNYVFDNQVELNTDLFINLFRQRIIDCFLQGWYNTKANSPVLNLYNHIKDNFEYESFLDKLPYDLRNYFIRLRVSSHSLRIQSGRYNRIPRNERICVFCNTNDIDDEFHFLFKCPCFNDLRTTFIPRYFLFRQSMFKFLQLLQSQNKTILIKVCKYIKLAFARRNSIMSA